MVVEDVLDKFINKHNYNINGCEVITQNRQNHKLRRGIEKLTKIIYGKDGKLLKLAKDEKFNILALVDGYKMTTLEKMELTRIEEKVLLNPTKGDIETMVQHNVKNAPRYALERERRQLYKAKHEAIAVDNFELVKETHRKISDITILINRAK